MSAIAIAARAGGRPKRKTLLGDVPTFENLSEHSNQFIGIKRLRKIGDVRKDSGKTRVVITGHKDKGPASLAKGLGYRYEAFATQIHIEHGDIAIDLIYEGEGPFDGTRTSGNFQTM
jgi:hypothetical protein